MAAVVVICFFPAFTPPSSGGEMRLGSLYRALSKTHDVIMLTSTDFGARFEEIVHTPRMRELRFPKDELWRVAYATLERSGVEGDLSGLAFALAVSNPDCALRRHARRLAATAQAVIHEFPFSEPIFADGCPCDEIYNSHNFELSLLSSIVWGAGFEEAFLKLMRLEGNLATRASRVLATSDSDAEKFRIFYGVPTSKLGICPNGFDEQELVSVVDERRCRESTLPKAPKLFFLGSGHHPDLEAAKYLIELAAEMPDCEFILGGGVCGSLANVQTPDNVRLIGAIDFTRKLRLLSEVDIFLNPVILGSGTSLKALEALGASVPMISTPEGVRGLDLVHGVDCEIVRRQEFPRAIRRMVSDEARRAGIAAGGLRTACKRFAWSTIAERLSLQLTERVESAAGDEALVLALNDYPVMLAGSGGIARVRSLLANLGTNVVLLSFGPKCEIGLIAPGVLHVTVEKTAAHLAFEASVNAGENVSVNDGVASLFAGSNRLISTLVSTMTWRAQAVVFEHPYMAPVLDAIKSVRRGIPIIYSAHNVEATLKANLLRRHRIGKSLTRFIAELEQRLVRRSQLVVCCTHADAEFFREQGANTIVVPNGCEIPQSVPTKVRVADGRDNPAWRAGFLGSSHGPNVEAAEYVMAQLAPAFPEVSFEMVGSVCTALKTPIPKNVVLHGMLSDSEKSRVMAEWNVALNPVEHGGGSSLKLPDYMAHGLVTINTPTGARGFEVEEYEAGYVVDRVEFPAVLAGMLEAPETPEIQGSKAREYAVSKLAWPAITSVYRDSLRGLIRAGADVEAPRLLVVTYRYTEPSLGGAEEYLIEILKRIRPRVKTLDLAAIDVDHITNQHHFGCTISTQFGGASRRIGELFDQALYFPPEEPPEQEMLERCRNLERTWANEEHSIFSQFAIHLAAPGKLRLFGGFFWPENHGGVVRRWTSPSFNFLIPSRACAFQLSGYGSVEKTLRVKLLTLGEAGDSTVIAEYERSIPVYFDVTVSLPAGRDTGCHVLRCEVDEHQAVSDHRPFGVLLERVSVILSDAGISIERSEQIKSLQMCVADLGEQIDEELRTQHFENWVSALFRNAGKRDMDMDRDFSLVRGPHSPALQIWLAENAAKYDAILIQGIPFDVIPSTVETLTRLKRRPRLVTLPHFHGDDRFYHWQRFFASFASADKTLLFSSSIAQRLGDQSTFSVVPGGGVGSDEHGDTHAIRSFRAVHNSEKPFFLCLGRKTAAKGYEQTIRAHQKLRSTGVDVDLVLIGPDEDGRQVSGEGVYYLGRQPRNAIRGALRDCLALVTMSQSESFGIVLCEAWLFGKPVIANRACYSFRELVKDGESGYLVTTEEDLQDAMASFASSLKQRERMGRSGFQEVNSRFTWERVADACFSAIFPSSVA